MLFCAAGWRSALATKTLQDMGLDKVAHIDGGFTAWKDKGAPVAADRRFKIGGVKITIDGSPQGRTAAFTTPYLTGGPGGEKNWKGELFAPDALVVLHELTGGVFRTVDVLAEAALRIAAQQDVRLVDRAIVRKALQLTPLA